MRRRKGTSENYPIQIDPVQAPDNGGRIGIALCPGKKDSYGAFAAWDRDLDLDLDEVQKWGATAVVSLITAREMEDLEVSGLRQAVHDRHMEWWHLPIRDGCPPGSRFETGWKSAGEAVRDRLHMGFDVFVHCKGGLGRAGTVAARLLVELGEGGVEAIGSVREAKKGAIENRWQEQHVKRSEIANPAAPSTAPEAIKDRAVGALVGLAVGDALGTTLEFARRDSKPRVVDIVGGGPFRLAPGCWTDDTSMALALADCLLASDSLDCRDLMDRFVTWWKKGEYSPTGYCFDIGGTIQGALERYRRTGEPLAGSTDRWSSGNGSLMRLAPVAVRFWNDRDRLDKTAAEQSRTTHGTLKAIDGCRAFAGLLADAISGVPRRDVLAPRSFDGAPAIAKILGGSWRGRCREKIQSTGYVVHTLEAAIWSVARTGNFRNAVTLAANLGDDADTVAAVTGQLAGAIYGLDGIPKAWVDRIAWSEQIRRKANRLVEASLLEA